MPMEITPASVVNRWKIRFPAAKNRPLMATAATRPMPMPTRTLRFIRSYFPAPKFCPTKVVTAMPRELFTIQYMESIFPKAVQAATVSVPREFREVWITMLEILYIVD